MIEKHQKTISILSELLNNCTGLRDAIKQHCEGMDKFSQEWRSSMIVGGTVNNWCYDLKVIFANKEEYFDSLSIAELYRLIEYIVYYVDMCLPLMNLQDEASQKISQQNRKLLDTAEYLNEILISVDFNPHGYKITPPSKLIDDFPESKKIALGILTSDIYKQIHFYLSELLEMVKWAKTLIRKQNVQQISELNRWISYLDETIDYFFHQWLNVDDNANFQSINKNYDKIQKLLSDLLDEGPPIGLTQDARIERDRVNNLLNKEANKLRKLLFGDA